MGRLMRGALDNQAMTPSRPYLQGESSFRYWCTTASFDTVLGRLLLFLGYSFLVFLDLWLQPDILYGRLYCLYCLYCLPAAAP